MSETKQSHDLDQLWERVNNQTSELSEISRSQTATEQKLDGFITRVDESMRTITSSLKALTDRVYQPPPPADYKGALSVLITALTAMVGFVYLTVSPLSKTDENIVDVLSDVTANTERKFELVAAELNTRQRTLGGMESILEWHQRELDIFQQQMDTERARNADIEERVSRAEGRMEMLIDRVKDIDDGGSRRWNKNRD